MEDRISILGYKPQKELVYNKLLPYQLDEESQSFLAEIKSNLGNIVLFHEPSPGIVHWINHLAKYIRLYGRKFCKEDHINFINLLFELLTIPHLELQVVLRVACTLNLLLKKKELLSREDLEIPWRPLYTLYETVLYSPYEHLGMLLLPGNLETTLKSLVRLCRIYFSSESTQEMLDEWRPLMCPFDLTMNKAMIYFELFLPTLLPPELHDQGFRLWFEEFMNIWRSCQSGPSWENSLVWLLSRLAVDSAGYVDWEPYIPMIFTRILRSFNLPGGPNKVQVNRPNSNFDTNAISNWIGAMLGGGSSCQAHVSCLFKALESYYHPSNNGRWMMKLQRLLYKLPAAVVKRLHRERYRSRTWEVPTPDNYRLTDDEVTSFVESIKPVVLLSMFSKGGSSDSAVALKNLSIIRPELVIPPLLERLYSSLETLTEPHRLTAAMHCVVAVARALVQNNKHFPEGPSHVIPLLMGALPGIDPNDIRKCMVTFQFISTFTTLIPLVDCSKAVHIRSDLTEQEQDLCLATVDFEDFVLQFMDRCFALIENSSLEHPTQLDRESNSMNVEENILEVGLSSTFSSVLTQSSPDVYEAALRKLHSFVSSHILEIKVAGKFAAHMCRSACRVDPKAALLTFVPHFSKLVLALLDSEDVAKEETLDDELLFSLLLLSEVARCDGSHLLAYFPLLEEVLHKTLHLTCRQGYGLAGILLRNILKALTLVYPLDFRSISIPWTEYLSFEHHLPTRDWGKPGDIHNLGLKWHVPNDAELDLAQNILEKFLQPELNLLEQWSCNEQILSRDDIQCSLNIIYECLIGAGGTFPQWPGEDIHLSKCSITLYCAHVKECGTKAIDFKDGKNVRQEIMRVINQVLGHIMKTCEDDTKSLFLIIKIYHALIFHWGASKNDFDHRWKGFHVVKKALENNLVRSKQHIRALLVDRTLLQHEMRLVERSRIPITAMHKTLLLDLLNLSTSHYSEVRKKAQDILQLCLRNFPYCYRIILPEVLDNLKKDPSVFHEQFKGVLYVILGHKQNSLLIRHDWTALNNIWPAVVSVKHSEKPSIIKLLDQFSTSIQKYFETIQIKAQVPPSCINLARAMWSDTLPYPKYPCLSDDQIEKARGLLEERNEENAGKYKSLVGSLVDLLNTGNLHWRHYHLALMMLSMLIRYDILLPAKAVQLFVTHLVHDTLNIRKIAIGAVCAILKQQKQRHPQREVDPLSIKVPSIHPLFGSPDKLPSNFWLQYNSLAQPKEKEQWEKSAFVHKTHVGFYSWSKPMKVYCSDEDQPKLDRERNHLSEEEQAVYDSFSQPQFIDSLISFISLEERKGHDKFDPKRFYMFKGLFRNFGDTFLPSFLDHLKRLTADTQESMQRCAAEVLAGLLRGSKHWNFEKITTLQKNIIPLLRTAVNNITPETLSDWGTCIATASESRDPNKYYWLFEFLMEAPLKEESGSFLESSWLYLLLGATAQQHWRVCELLHRLLEYFKPQLNHSYQNVRERLGSLLSNIFMYDVTFTSTNDYFSLVPKRAPFVSFLLPQLKILHEDNSKGVSDISISEQCNPSTCETTKDECMSGDVPHKNHFVENSQERKHAVNLLRTVCRWLMTSVSRTLYSAPPEIYQLLPILCLMESDTADDELQKECTITIAVIGQALLLPDSIYTAINSAKQISISSSWHARAAALSFLQIMIFSNLFTVLHHPQWVQETTDLVLKLLQDERVEVRETAADTLGGLLHCEFVKITEELLALFKSKCKRKIRHKIHCKEGKGQSIHSTDLIEHHAGILGLCACVNAYPYEVPEFLPDILVLLGDHLNDPQPIPTTIKKTLSNFRRTHHDSWRDHKLKFTDDQLAVITDLLVSPSYYA